MIGGCLFSTRYTMTAKVYKKISTTSSSGQIKYSWQVDGSIGDQGVIDCIVMPFQSKSFTRQGVGETFGNTYNSFVYLKMNSRYNIAPSAQIADIRSKLTGELVFREMDLKNNPGTWFNTAGSSPSIDPFGAVTEYQTLLARAESQGGL